MEMGSFASFPSSSTVSNKLGHVLNFSAKHSLNAYGHLSWSAALLPRARKCELVLIPHTLQSENVDNPAMGQLVRRTLHSLRTVVVNLASKLRDHTRNAKWRQLTRFSSEATAGKAKDSSEKASVNRRSKHLEPLPDTLHAVLPPETIGNGRVIIVGDIHGTNLNPYSVEAKVHCVPTVVRLDWILIGG